MDCDLRCVSSGWDGDSALLPRAARDETAALTEETEEVKREMRTDGVRDERVAGLYGVSWRREPIR